jgi:hypothetical protein
MGPGLSYWTILDLRQPLVQPPGFLAFATKGSQEPETTQPL